MRATTAREDNPLHGPERRAFLWCLPCGVPGRAPASGEGERLAAGRAARADRRRGANQIVVTSSTRGDRYGHPQTTKELLFAAQGNCCSKRDLTFDMSGGPKGAKRPLERPLDGGVRFRQ